MAPVAAAAEAHPVPRGVDLGAALEVPREPAEALGMQAALGQVARLAVEQRQAPAERLAAAQRAAAEQRAAEAQRAWVAAADSLATS